MSCGYLSLQITSKNSFCKHALRRRKAKQMEPDAHDQLFDEFTI